MNSGSFWDFFLAGSLRFVFVNSSWYNDNHSYHHSANLSYLDILTRAGFHINGRPGIFTDHSICVSTFGHAIHQYQS